MERGDSELARQINPYFWDRPQTAPDPKIIPIPIKEDRWELAKLTISSPQFNQPIEFSQKPDGVFINYDRSFLIIVRTSSDGYTYFEPYSYDGKNLSIVYKDKYSNQPLILKITT